MFVRVGCLAVALVFAESLFALPLQESERNRSARQAIEDARKKKVDQPIPPPRFVAQPPILVPGENAWAVRIVTGAGLTGSGRGNLTVTSEGSLVINGLDGACTRTLDVDSMDALGRMIASADPSATWAGSKVSELCRDCYQTTLVLQRREAGGVERTYSLIWDDSTQAQIPADALTIYRALMAHEGCKQ